MILVRRLLYVVLFLVIAGKIIGFFFGDHEVARTGIEHHFKEYLCLLLAVEVVALFVFHKVYVWCCGGEL